MVHIGEKPFTVKEIIEDSKLEEFLAVQDDMHIVQGDMHDVQGLRASYWRLIKYARLKRFISLVLYNFLMCIYLLVVFVRIWMFFLLYILYNSFHVIPCTQYKFKPTPKVFLGGLQTITVRLFFIIWYQSNTKTYLSSLWPLLPPLLQIHPPLCL